MSISFGKPRAILPPQNLGVKQGAQRRLNEAAIKAANRASAAIAVDAYQARIWHPYRGPGVTTCPCCRALKQDNSASNLGTPNSNFEIVLPGGEGTDRGGVDENAINQDTGIKRTHYDEGSQGADFAPRLDENDDIMRLLLGNGTRCGICWGTGTINGYRLHGGERIVCTIVNTMGAELIDETGLDVDSSSQTPTLIGPGKVTWKVEIPYGFKYLDAIRVCDGLVASNVENIAVKFSSDNEYFTDVNSFFGGTRNVVLSDNFPNIFYIQLTLGEHARVSFIDIVLRSTKLQNVQLPQFVQALNAELVAPFISSDFELDPAITHIERGALIAIPTRFGRMGSVWVITDVTVKQTAMGAVFNIVGQVRNVQPTEVLAAASIDASAFTGVIGGEIAYRGLEPSSLPSGLPGGETDVTVKAVQRPTQRVPNGGSISNTIPLSAGYSDDDEIVIVNG